jgi:hypothetical protein
MHDLSCFQLRFSFQGLFGFYSLNPPGFCDTSAMRSRRATTHRTASLRISSAAAHLKIAFLLLASATASQLPAQSTPPAPPSDNPGYTLHVYVNLVQIPTLVLSPSFSPLPPISLGKFNISLDSGPRFHPTHMRREGDDPIDLAILLDLSGNAFDLRSELSPSILALSTQSLQPHDHVSIYAIDCLLVRTANDIPATEGDRIAHAMDAAISFPTLHGAGESATPHCGNSIHLWNALATVAQSISTLPRRRVILVISNGRDHQSPVHWNDLRRYADSRSITFFGLYPNPIDPDSLHFTLSTEDPFNQLCQLTGGLILFTSSSNLSDNLQRTIAFVRGRYILEFPRPDVGKGGVHDIDVTLTKTDAYIRPAGVSYPDADPSIAKDPTTLPSTPSPAVFGNRHPVPIPQ